MANYLVAKVNSSTTSYSLRNTEPSKPYLKVSNSYLPLTTSTKTGLQVKVNNVKYNIQESYSTTIRKTSTINWYYTKTNLMVSGISVYNKTESSLSTNRLSRFKNGAVQMNLSNVCNSTLYIPIKYNPKLIVLVAGGITLSGFEYATINRDYNFKYIASTGNSTFGPADSVLFYAYYSDSTTKNITINYERSSRILYSTAADIMPFGNDLTIFVDRTTTVNYITGFTQSSYTTTYTNTSSIYNNTYTIASTKLYTTTTTSQ